MLRHRCAACGKPINRTDLFFEESDGTLCRACMLRSTMQPTPQKVLRGACPTWATLPDLRHKPVL